MAIPTLAGLCSYEEAARPSYSVADNVALMLRYAWIEKRAMETGLYWLSARATASCRRRAMRLGSRSTTTPARVLAAAAPPTDRRRRRNPERRRGRCEQGGT